MKRKNSSTSSPTSPKRVPKKAKPRAIEPEVMPREAEIVEPESETDEDTDASIEVEPTEDEIQSSVPKSLPAQTDVTRETETGDTELAAVSPTDPLRRYLDEIRHYRLLDPQEEFELAMRLKEKGDLDAAKRLVQANLRLVVKIALEYRSFYSNLLDLIQEGNIGLMKAVSKFDPTKGARLGYYSSWWIRSYILKYLLDNFRLVKIGTTQAQKKLFYHLMREKERLEAQGLLAGPKLLAERLDVREKDVIEMEQRLSSRGSEMSLDAPVDPESGRSTSHMDYLTDDHEAADDLLARQELLKLLSDRLPTFEKQLSDKELKILRDRLLSEEPKTLQEVADLYGLTRERVRQIEAKLIQKLREFLRPDLGA